MASSYCSCSSSSHLAVLNVFFILVLSSTSANSSEPTVYDILPQFGLPKGLLPDCVSNYTFNPSDGTFSVELPNPCYIQFDYLVYYEERITGTLKMGSIKNLKGIQVKRFFFWFDVDEIKVDLPPNDAIYFQVGLVNKKLGIHQFQTVRSCDSGLRSSPPWNRIFQLPPPVQDEIEMLLTE